MITAAEIEEARVRQVILAIPTLADIRAFDAILPLFADRVTIDYTSLFGGNPQELSGQDVAMFCGQRIDRHAAHRIAHGAGLFRAAIRMMLMSEILALWHRLLLRVATRLPDSSEP